MKTRLASVLALLVALSASVLNAASASADNSPFAYTVSAVLCPNNYNIITLGATPMTVLRFLGARQRQLSNDVWAYTGFYPKVEAGQERGCDTLIVTFSNGQVSDLKIVNQRATSVIAANLKTLSAPIQVAKN